MAKLTIGRMANLYGLHRSTLHEAVTKGRVTAGLDGKGQKVIDLSEMIRVYGEPSGFTRHSPTPPPYTSALHLTLHFPYTHNRRPTAPPGRAAIAARRGARVA